MRNLMRRFLRSEDGNSTVDGTVLLACLVVLALAVVGGITTGMIDVSKDISDEVGAIEVQAS